MRSSRGSGATSSLATRFGCNETTLNPLNEWLGMPRRFAARLRDMPAVTAADLTLCDLWSEHQMSIGNDMRAVESKVEMGGARVSLIEIYAHGGGDPTWIIFRVSDGFSLDDGLETKRFADLKGALDGIGGHPMNVAETHAVG